MYEKTITISGANVLADLAGFPLKVVIDADSGLGAHARADGYDVRFTNADGTVTLPHHRYAWTRSGGNVTAEFYVRCNISTSGTTIKMVYGDPALDADTSAAMIVWQDYDSVHKLVNDNQSVLEAPDITGNGRHMDRNHNSPALQYVIPTTPQSVGTVLADSWAGVAPITPVHFRRVETGTDRTKTLSAIHHVQGPTHFMCMCARHDQWNYSSGGNTFRYFTEPVFAIGDNPTVDSMNAWSSPGVPYDHTTSFGFFAAVFPGSRMAGDTKLYRGGVELPKTYHNGTSAATQMRPYGYIKCFRDWAPPTTAQSLRVYARDFRVFDGDPGPAWTGFEARNLFGTGEIVLGPETDWIPPEPPPPDPPDPPEPGDGLYIPEFEMFERIVTPIGVMEKKFIALALCPAILVVIEI
jgi:Domain of unknown function (DUF2341).